MTVAFECEYYLRHRYPKEIMVLSQKFIEGELIHFSDETMLQVDRIDRRLISYQNAYVVLF